MTEIEWSQPQQWDRSHIFPAPELLEVQHLLPVQDSDRARLKADILRHGVREPLYGYCKGNNFYYLTGHTRAGVVEELDRSGGREFKQLPVRHVLCWPVEMNMCDFALSDNLNRRHLTESQKRDVITYVLKSRYEDSDKCIGQLCGADGKTVAGVRRELEIGAVIPRTSFRRDSAGRMQPATKPPRLKLPDLKPEPVTSKASSGISIPVLVQAIVEHITSRPCDDKVRDAAQTVITYLQQEVEDEGTGNKR